MFKNARLSRGVPLAVLILTGCAINALGDAVDDTKTGAGYRGEQRSVEEDFPEVARNCQIPAATVSWTRSAYRLILPADLYAARDRPPAAGRISCITDWAHGRGLTLTVEARR
jgi:hypothetical protein